MNRINFAVSSPDFPKIYDKFPASLHRNDMVHFDPEEQASAFVNYVMKKEG